MSSFSRSDASLIPRRRLRFRSGACASGSSSGASGISGDSRFRLESSASRTEQGWLPGASGVAEDSHLDFAVESASGIGLCEQGVGVFILRRGEFVSI